MSASSSTRGLCLALAGLAGLGVLLWRRGQQAIPRPVPTGPRVLILGGGWGGIYTALTLEKAAPQARIELVSRDNFFLFTPLLPDAAASAVDTRHIVNPIRRLFRTAQFVQGEVEDVDLTQRKATIRLPDGHRRIHEYDHLVLALGSVTNFFGMADVERHALTMKTLGDALVLRNHVISMLEQADVAEPSRRQALVTFLLVGGGLAGVEVAGHLNDFVRAALVSYPNVPPREVRIVLAEAQPRLMAEMSAELATFALAKLRERGVEVWLSARLASATATSARFDDGRELPTETIVWQAGVAPSPFLARLPLERDKRGRVAVDQYLRVLGHSNVWAVGDCASVPNLRHGGSYPPTAQHALREAHTLGRNLAATLDGRPLRPFDYPLRIQLASIGHQTGVAYLMGLKLYGFVAWWLWRSYYLLRLPRLEKRLRVTLDWTLDVIFPRDIVQLKLVEAKESGA